MCVTWRTVGFSLCTTCVYWKHYNIVCIILLSIKKSGKNVNFKMYADSVKKGSSGWWVKSLLSFSLFWKIFGWLLGESLKLEWSWPLLLLGSQYATFPFWLELAPFLLLGSQYATYPFWKFLDLPLHLVDVNNTTLKMSK